MIDLIYVDTASFLRSDMRANMFVTLLVGFANISAITFYSRRAWLVGPVGYHQRIRCSLVAGWEEEAVCNPLRSLGIGCRVALPCVCWIQRICG